MTKSESATEIPVLDDHGATWRPVAVIDIGTSLIRMVIAEISSHGEIHRLEDLSRAVNLGKDSFTRRSIRKQTIEECVQVFKSFRSLMEQYQIKSADQIRAVATSAVREAINKLAFLDRIYIATGIEIQILDEAEVNRITYLGVQPRLAEEPSLKDANICLAEIGGGSTELLLINGKDVLYSNTFRLGSLRLREMLESAGSSASSSSRSLLKPHITQSIERMLDETSDFSGLQMVSLGGDMRFVAHQLNPEWDRETLACLSAKDLADFAEKILSMSEDKLVRKYHLTLNDAETLGIALMAYTELAKAFKVRTVYVSSLNMRDGLLLEMTSQGTWSSAFEDQVIRSAIDVGHKFNFDEKHSKHVANLSRLLFRELVNQHQLDPHYESLLYVAALLHEIGLFIGTRGYHKHSMYLIQHATVFGISEKNLELIAMIVRYHRRASPKPSHVGFASLNRDARVIISKLAAILRVAVALDQSYSQRIQSFTTKMTDNRFEINVRNVEDLSLEQIALKQNNLMFEEIYGVPVLLRRDTTST
ncbi:Exopolyphosphatase [Polystyrenella longa]|uniref:Exopolyphosphatase n=1 Tax=Polystyrenella longa TaxID=2528007 RepID=A0A518CNV4_9PLAN|nr:Ppx/GppA phosphatase family protein [Polystyrenella longa]QDU80906.1 Exopolyphosphatase [Polystyrenella longa]